MKKLSETIKYFIRILTILSGAGKVYLIIIVLLALFFGIIPSISVIVMQEIVNTLQMNSQNSSYLIILIAMYIAIDIFSGILRMVSGYIENVLQLKASVTLNMSVLEKVKEFSLKDFEDHETYNLIQRANNIDISQLFNFFKSIILVLQSIINLTLFSLILMSWRWWFLPVISIVPIINIFVSVYFGKKQFLINKNRTDAGRKLWYFKYLLTNDMAFKEISIFSLGDYFRSKYRQISLSFIRQDKNILNNKTGAQSTLFIIDQIISSFLFTYVILKTFAGELFLGNMNTYVRSISNVNSSLQSFLSQVNTIYQSALNIGQYFDFIDMKTQNTKCDNMIPLCEIPFIKIKNLSYKYKNQKKHALNNINLRVDKGNIIAFIGQNGSGKTTLIKILSTLYNDFEGDVYFGNNNLRDLKPELVHKKIGLLFQDFIRYQLTVRENIALGQLEKINNDSAIIQALSKTGMQEKIINLDEQLGFWFHGGIQLSGGEWLKIALSRAFIRDAEIYLLDEPNAALDAISEKKILDSFKELCEGKIGIIVSHRIASIKNIANKIIVFDNGFIQAEGTHEYLLNNSDIYREMYNNEEGIEKLVNP